MVLGSRHPVHSTDFLPREKNVVKKHGKYLFGYFVLLCKLNVDMLNLFILSIL